MSGQKRGMHEIKNNSLPKKKQKVCDTHEESETDDWDNWDQWDQDKWIAYYDKSNGINSLLFNRNNYIYKVARNRTISPAHDLYDNFHFYFDIYVCDNLKVNELKLINLKKELVTLGNNNNDWTTNELINIIDPDLYMYKYYERTKWSDKFKPEFDKDIKLLLEDVVNENRLLAGVALTTKEQEWNKLIENENKGYFVRSTQRWLVTEFNENKTNNKIQIVSSIHNISPRYKYENIYKGIEYIFQQMLPLFNKFDSFKHRKNNSFQCIVKSQRFCINDQRRYKGVWHKEGLTENIIIVGLYCFEKDEKLKGGDLKFRNVFGYHDRCFWLQFSDLEHDGIDASEYVMSPTVSINHGTAVVFDNTNLVNRIKMLKNEMADNKTRYQSFLTFFIIDPTKATNISTKYYPTLKREEYANIVIEYGCSKCPFDLAMEICDFGQCGFTLQQAKHIRLQNITIKENSQSNGRWASSGDSGFEKIWYKNGKANQYEHIEKYLCPERTDWDTTSDSEF